MERSSSYCSRTFTTIGAVLVCRPERLSGAGFSRNVNYIADRDRLGFATFYALPTDFAVSFGVYGARPLRRAIQKEILDPLSIDILEGKVREGQTVHVDAKDGALEFREK